MDNFREVFNRLTGWCPHAQQRRICTITAPTENLSDLPGGGNIPDLSFGWKNRYFTRTLFFALCMTGVGTVLFASATGDRIAMLGIGLVLATLLYSGDAVQYWHAFERVAKNGSAQESDWHDISVVRVLPIIGVALVLGFVGIVLLGLLPGLSMLMVNGFLAGFAAIGWYHLVTILFWERKTGIALFSNGDLLYRRR